MFSVSFVEAQEDTALSTEQKNTYVNLNTEKPDSKIIIGALENVRLVPPNEVLKARIDTGAKTTSIDARNITPFERDGKQWVRFDFVSGKKEHTIERKVVKTVQIKRHGAESMDRYVVKMRVILGDVSQLISVNLSDREEYKYPVLIGRNFLRDFFIVDVSKKYQFKPMSLPK
ncbi:RimK/LysX family protein [Sulfurovum sp. XGS-02]|uniref:ATP-dependent zinc protease family protein n=1 Tax=Sulfurovum sp. XGS-02 TaxID=2925411 RepID=UPI00205B34A6|nr:RimK/LysX family protein [Sulfurovum sp. XGS-02]UPT77836.1 RimK/LysX family protein [Sulfurovum sp. XGS-02]